jgi:hypothetical protein
VILNKNGDLTKITFDKHLVGKLLDYITDMTFTTKVIVVTYLESRVTILTFGKPLDFLNPDCCDNIAQADPKLQIIDLLGPPGRRLNRKIQISSDSSTCLFWWSLSGQEVFPWAPHLNEEDRANVILFSLRSKKSIEPRRLGFARTHSDPVLFRYIIAPILIWNLVL